MRALWKAIQLPIPALAQQRKLDEIIPTQSHLLDGSNRIETGTTRQAILFYFFYACEGWVPILARPRVSVSLARWRF
jgi:hypothetical protein